MAARKIDGHWYVDFRLRRERIRRRSPHDTKGGAVQYELELRQRLLSEPSVRSAIDPAGQPTFAQFVERWMRDYVSVKNKWSEQLTKRRKLKARLIPAFGALKLDEITSLQVDRFVAQMQRDGLSAKTINNHLTILRKCLVVAVRWKELKDVPSIEFLETQIADIEAVPADSLVRLQNALPEPWRTLVLTAAKTGLRFNELAALRWVDVNLDEQEIYVCQGEVFGRVGPPKTASSIRAVPLTSDVVAALRGLARCHERVFIHNGRSITYGSAWYQITAGCKRAGIAHTSWHPLRHTYVTELSARGVPDRTIADLVGHSKIEMMLRYRHRVSAAKRAAVQTLEPGMPTVWAVDGHPAVLDAPPFGGSQK